MSEVIDKLAACEQITEWVTPWDKRLAAIAGIAIPQAGGNLRQVWEVANAAEEQEVAQHVGRLIVPANVSLHGAVAARFNNHIFVDGPDMGVGSGNVELEFTDMSDWSACFPVHDRTMIFREHGRRVWASLALSERTIALAIFAEELEQGGVLARVQQVPEEDLERL